MTSLDKDTLYIDVDDEITTIIDKVRSSNGRIIALVLPKRATVLQSIVNMKLLKRAADAAKKRVVLITTEANLMPLTGAVGLHVAPTLQTRPEIPAVHEPDGAESDAPEAAEPAFTLDNAGERPVGELAEQSGHVVGSSAADDETAAAAEAATFDDEAEAAESPARDRSLAVPNFNRFRLLLLLGGAAVIALGVFIYLAIFVLPRAVIAITTNTSTVDVSIPVTLDPSAQALDTAKGVVPVKSEQQSKTTSQQVNTTGQKNTGNSASGSVAMTAEECAPNLGTPANVPSGTGVSTSGLTFITTQVASFTFAHFSGGSCAIYTSNTVAMTAQSPGAKYNVSNATFTVAGRQDITSATGSASGGTDNIIQVVAQADIDGAKQKLAAPDTDSIKTSLEQTLTQDGLYPLPATFVAGTPNITTSANVGDTADTVTVNQAVTYTMFGAKQSDLDKLLAANVATHIDTQDQAIQNDGLQAASMSVTNNTPPTENVTLQTTAVVGPTIDMNAIKSEAKGKKSGDVANLIEAIPGVTKVQVQLSPFWVSTVPSDPSKVTVTIDKKS